MYTYMHKTKKQTLSGLSSQNVSSETILAQVHSSAFICHFAFVAPLLWREAHKWGWAAVYCCVNFIDYNGYFLVPIMDLPQTAPGVPATGIDPPMELLEAMQTLANVWDWLGTAPAPRAAFVAALGGGEPRIRDIVYIKGADYDVAVAGVRVARVPDGEALPLLPMVLGHLSMLRRICRLRLGLTANEEAPNMQPAPPAGAVGLQVAVANAPIPPLPTGDSKIKLSVILDPTLDVDLLRMPSIRIRQLFAAYKLSRGAEPAEEIEPTHEQISAVQQVSGNDQPPYADFSIFGPYGKRLAGKITYLAWSFQPDGTWIRRELPGPPSIDQWWASFRVLRTVFLLLYTCPPEVIDNYGEMVRSFHNTYGPSSWFLIYTADVRMRSEHLERLRRHAEGEHDDALAAGLPTSFDPAKPWHAAFRAAVGKTARDWWEDNLHRPALLYLTRCKTAHDSVADGTVQDFLPGSAAHLPPPAPAPHSEPRQRSRSRNPGPRKGNGSGKPDRQGQGSGPRLQGDFTNKGNRICDDYNTAGGCRRKNCKDVHMCKSCRQNQCSKDCTYISGKGNRPPVRLTPAPNSPPRFRQGGGGGQRGGGGNRRNGKDSGRR